jgi:uncharacterized alpha-E superfamily protein
MGRQLERTDDTARMLNVNINLLLDSSLSDVENIWRRLIGITGSLEQFQSLYQKHDERNVVKFMIADRANGISILSSIRFVRENARTTREIIPAEVWERINELYHYASHNAADSLSRKKRIEFLQQVMPVCQLVMGLIETSMRHDPAYYFFRLGVMIERADMISRIVDVGVADMLARERSDNVIGQADNNSMWMSVLNSLSAFQAYQLYVQGSISASGVTEFLIKDPRFPRAVRACLYEIITCLDNLPRNESVIRDVLKLKRVIDKADTDELLEGEIHNFIDGLQQTLNELHANIAETWFLPPSAA